MCVLTPAASCYMAVELPPFVIHSFILYGAKETTQIGLRPNLVLDGKVDEVCVNQHLVGGPQLRVVLEEQGGWGLLTAETTAPCHDCSCGESARNAQHCCRAQQDSSVPDIVHDRGRQQAYMCLTSLAASFFMIFSGLQEGQEGLVTGIPHCLNALLNGLHLSHHTMRQDARLGVFRVQESLHFCEFSGLLLLAHGAMTAVCPGL